MAVWNPNKRNVAPVLCAALATAGIFLPFRPLPAYAQNTAATSSVVNSLKPDVQILVMVLPTGTTAVSSVYPGQVPKATAMARIDRLIKLTGWKAQNKHFSDAPAAPPLIEDETKQKLSVASFETSSPVFSNDGTVDWETFLRAFGDVHRVNVILFTDMPYTGPTQFNSDRVALTVAPNPGKSIVAAANIIATAKDQAAFGIPKIAPQNPVQEKAKVVANTNPSRRTAGIVLAVTVAGIFAFLIYRWTANYAARR